MSTYVSKQEAKIRNRYNQVPHLTQNTTWESDKITIKHHIQDLHFTHKAPPVIYSRRQFQILLLFQK